MNVENEQELYILVMNAPEGICVLNAQTLAAEIVNDSFIALAGKSREAILGNFYWDTFPGIHSIFFESPRLIAYPETRQRQIIAI